MIVAAPTIVMPELVFRRKGLCGLGVVAGLKLFLGFGGNGGFGVSVSVA